MKYIILMSSPENSFESLSEEEQKRVVGEHDAFTEALQTAGKYVCSFRLGSPADARSVERDASGALSVRSGPFCEGKEVLGGLYVIEADSADEALAWAQRSRFTIGSNEVRPLWA